MPNSFFHFVPTIAIGLAVMWSGVNFMFLVPCAPLVVGIVGVFFGVVGVLQGSRHKAFSIAGLALNLVVIIVTIMRSLRAEVP